MLFMAHLINGRLHIYRNTLSFKYRVIHYLLLVHMGRFGVFLKTTPLISCLSGIVHYTVIVQSYGEGEGRRLGVD